ncbi:hypothetical protein [Aeromonas veronii]|uniref:hypothetical protein n=1 Tax=Aeromonas veronii TaxID=654 RepID=UPI0019201291|nr:hypothetical protein [Aeromonas veronii]MBL0493016.1 hypothetical protein [Aeromonas veronii]
MSIGPARNKAPWRGYQRQSGGGISLQLRPLRAAFQEVSQAVNEFEFDQALQLLESLLG